MDTQIITALIATALAIGIAGFLGLAADRWGVDSRPRLGDDHQR